MQRLKIDHEEVAFDRSSASVNPATLLQTVLDSMAILRKGLCCAPADLS